jgi:tRNA-dihydrouridine synthase
MIARGAFGQPWIFHQTRDLMEGKAMRSAPAVEDRFKVAIHHATLVAEYEADPRGAAIEFRKHLGWYVKGLADSAEMRRRLYAVESLAEIQGIFEEYLETHSPDLSQAAAA